MSDDFFTQVFSRDRILSGSTPPTQRANTLLFHIESRTAHLVAQSQATVQKFLTEEAAHQREMTFIDAFNLGKAPPVPPTIQEIERFAPQWATLVPDNDRLKAALAHQLGQKYRFGKTAVSQLRATLSLDTPALQTAYHTLYQTPLDTIYTAAPTPRERLAWQWNRLGTWLENLPPFWSVYALTLTEVVGASVLALPIALASIGPLPSILLLVIFGLMNVLTVAHMAETASRSGGIRYGSAFLGQVVSDYLGRVGSLILSLGLFALITLVLLAFYIGFATTIAAPTGIPAAVWVAALFATGLYYVTRGSINATVTSSLVVGAVNLSLIFILMLLAAPHIKLANLLYVNIPFVGGRPFDPSLLELIFGVVLAGYFGHLSVPNSARTVLQRDPSGGSLVRGAMAAQVTVIVVYSIWIAIINGAIAPEVMAAESGTALTPLANEIGPIVYLFGTIFVILGMGMITIHFALGLFNLTREWLPQQQQPAIALRRREGRLRLHPRRQPATLPQVNLVYLGLTQGQPYFRLDVQTRTATRHMELTIGDSWESTPLLEVDDKLLFTVKVVEAQAQWARVQLSTRLAVRYEAGRDEVGLSMLDLLQLPDAMAELATWLVRERRTTLAAAVAHLGQTEEATAALLADLRERGFVREVEENGRFSYQPRLSTTRTHRLSADMASKISDAPVAATAPQTRPLSLWQQLFNPLLTERGRFFLGLVPMMLVFIAAELQLLTGSQSFTGPLSFIGVVVIAMLAGIYPVLLLPASRQKGEIVPDVVYRIIGNRLLLAIIYLTSLGGILVHGLFIWENPVQRVLALLVAAVIVIVTVNSWWQGAFVPRLVVNILAQPQQAMLSLAASGQPYAAPVQLSYQNQPQTEQPAAGTIPNFATLRQATFQLPAGVAHELKVWAFELNAEGSSQPLPTVAELVMGEETAVIDLQLTSGQFILPLPNQPATLTLSFNHSANKNQETA